MTFEIAKYDRQTVVPRQLIEFLMNRLAPVIRAFELGRTNRHLGSTLLDGPLPISGNLEATGGAAGDSMKPGRQRISHPQPVSFAGQNEKGRLECILCIVIVADDASADAQDHRTVTLDQFRECDLGRLSVARANCSSSSRSESRRQRRRQRAFEGAQRSLHRKGVALSDPGDRDRLHSLKQVEPRIVPTHFEDSREFSFPSIVITVSLLTRPAAVRQSSRRNIVLARSRPMAKASLPIELGQTPLTDLRSLGSSTLYHVLVVILASLAVIPGHIAVRRESTRPKALYAEIDPVDNRESVPPSPGEGGGGPGEIGGTSSIPFVSTTGGTKPAGGHSRSDR